MARKPILLVKPPDRFLQDEFVYQQLGPHYLQAFLDQSDIASDILVLYEKPEIHNQRINEEADIELELSDLKMLLLSHDGASLDTNFDPSLFQNYDIVAMSVMTPQAPDAYLLNELIRRTCPHVTTVIGGSHPRYYQKQVENLPDDISFDFIVPQDGWGPILKIATGSVLKNEIPQILVEKLRTLSGLPPPTRPTGLMKKYNFEIAGVPAFHTITALGCPFTCHFCESGIESVRTFSPQMIEDDLATVSSVHDNLNHQEKAIMFFDDVGLMSPKQVERLSQLIEAKDFDTWRAFTHAYLVVRHREKLLTPFVNTGGKRIGIGIETGSQRSLDLINKRNGKMQPVSDHYDAISIANELGVAVDAFTMIYPWEDENDLAATTDLVEFVVSNKVNGIDAKGRPLKNHVDSTIMSPFQGTKFYDLMRLGKIANVEINTELDPGATFYKGANGGSGWPYRKSRLPRSEYENVQRYRNSLRPSYR